MRLRLFVLSLLVSTAPVAAAHAQSTPSPFARDRNVSVTERPRPDFDAAGLRAGAFFIYPKVSLDVTQDDNIYASQTNEVSDTVWSLRPEIEAVSQWSRHQVRGLARLNTYRYTDADQEDNTTYNVEGSGRLDVLRGSYLRGTAGYAHEVEARTSPSAAQFFAEPIEYERVYGNFGGSHEFNRLRVSGEVRYANYDFDDTQTFAGVPIDQSYRNRTNWEQNARIDYAVSPALSLFGTATHNDRSYDNGPRFVGDVSRDSEGWELGVGADFDLTALVRGQVQVGYLTQEFDDPRIGDADGLGLRSRVEWFPTELTTVTVAAERSVDDTGVVGSAGSLATRASAQVDHELLRNLILTGRLAWAEDDFRGLDRTDNQTGVLLGANYLISRRVGVFGSYNFLRRESDGAQLGNEFESNRLQVGVVLQY